MTNKIDTCDRNCQSCTIRNKSIFKNLSDEDLQALEAMKVCRIYKKGEIVFVEATHARGLYCVYSGKIKVLQTGADGKEQIVHLIHDGNVMGHRAILGDDTFSCSAIALEDSHVCFIPKKPFYEMVEQNAKLALNIAHLLSDELKEAEHKITSTAQHSVKERIVEALLILKKNYGVEDDTCTINIDIKRLDLATLAGTSRETATRFLYEFQDQHVIELIGKRIKILDENRLLQILIDDKL